MGDIFQFVWHALWRAPADLLDALFHMPLWKLLGGAVVLTLSVLAITALPDLIRDWVKYLLLIALALIATFEIFRPFDLSAILG